MKFNPDIHHRRSIRLKGYDYSREGAYFITMCVQNRECIFGEIINGDLRLNEVGHMIHMHWAQINKKYTHVELDHFIVMPNHLHGIIIINDYYHRFYRRGEVTSPLHLHEQLPKGPPILGKIVAWFKYQSTKHFNQLRQAPGTKLWQRNYYERIIRNEKEFNQIIYYIIDNPFFWDSDKENPSNLRDSRDVRKKQLRI